MLLYLLPHLLCPTDIDVPGVFRPLEDFENAFSFRTYVNNCQNQDLNCPDSYNVYVLTLQYSICNNLALSIKDYLIPSFLESPKLRSRFTVYQFLMRIAENPDKTELKYINVIWNYAHLLETNDISMVASVFLNKKRYDLINAIVKRRKPSDPDIKPYLLSNSYYCQNYDLIIANIDVGSMFPLFKQALKSHICDGLVMVLLEKMQHGDIVEGWMLFLSRKKAETRYIHKIKSLLPISTIAGSLKPSYMTPLLAYNLKYIYPNWENSFYSLRKNNDNVIVFLAQHKYRNVRPQFNNLWDVVLMRQALRLNDNTGISLIYNLAHAKNSMSIVQKKLHDKSVSERQLYWYLSIFSYLPQLKNSDLLKLMLRKGNRDVLIAYLETDISDLSEEKVVKLAVEQESYELVRLLRKKLDANLFKKGIDQAQNKEKYVSTYFQSCAMCMGDLNDQEIEKTECNHIFHKKCLDTWDKSSISQRIAGGCPLCKKMVYRTIKN